MSEAVDFDASASGAVISDEVRADFQQPVAILLGAGASIEAGIPGSFGMTDEIVRTINDYPVYQYNHQGWALNFVCGALQAHSTSIGGSYHDSLDVEYVASAVALLATRHRHEAAAFVQQWNPVIQEIEIPSAPPFIENKFKSALSAGASAIQRAIASGGKQGVGNIKSAMEQGAAGLQQTISDLIDARSGRQSTRVYEELQETMTAVLCEKVAISGNSAVEYLSPLVKKARSQGSLVVGTLNYDRSIETVCTAHGLPYSTGIESWSSNRTFESVTEGIQLIKLHGSIDWVDRGGGYTAAGRLPSMQVTVQQWSGRQQGKPIIVFGRDKLRASGPFLDLLREWETQIQEFNILLVVGYSFRDDHINETISRWLNENSDRQLYIVDPGWPITMRHSDEFRYILYRLLAGLSATAGGPPKRLHVIRARTSEALRLLFDPPA